MLPDRASKRLQALPDISKEGKRVNGLFRLMEVPELWLQAYANINANKGAMTPGVGPVTMDGFSIERAVNLIELLKDGRYRPKPVRRTYVPKPNGKMRPLGMPSGDDKLVQEMVRMLLEQIYEPVFSNWSHGFRPKRSCHTALKQVERWNGTKWLVEVDIEGFFDNIDHEVMIELLEKKIDDKRFIDLTQAFLKAGYMEDWRFHGTYSGTPQGGILSPILANVYLHELDRFMETMMASFTKGERRETNPKYYLYAQHIYQRRKAMRELRELGETKNAPTILKLRQQIREYDSARKGMHARNPLDPTFRRLHYCRYADDTLAGVTGSKHDAIEVMEGMKEFTKNTLRLNIAEGKSKISHASEGTVFLGYEVISKTIDRKKRVRARSGVYTANRTVVEQMTLRIPEEKLLRFCHKKGYGDYVTHKTRHRGALLQRSDAEVILTFNAELRGLANYYCLAYGARARLHKLQYLWRGGLLKTLAAKHKTTVVEMVKRLKRGSDFALEYEVKGRRKNLFLFSLRHWKEPRNASRSIDIEPYTYEYTLTRTEIIERLSAEVCEYCGVSKGYFEVHHVRKLKDVKDGKALWQKVMAAMQRKKLVLCIECHDRLHRGELPDWRWRKHIEVESRVP
jgi:group II intron reverse transcriptase/maturase